MTINVDIIKVGKVLPTKKHKSKYGAPPRGRTIYCEIYNKEGNIFKYNFYFIKTDSYNIPKDWYNPNGYYSRCYKCLNLKTLGLNRMNNCYNKIYKNPIFKLNYKSLDEIQQIIVINKI